MSELESLDTIEKILLRKDQEIVTTRQYHTISSLNIPSSTIFIHFQDFLFKILSIFIFYAISTLSS